MDNGTDGHTRITNKFEKAGVLVSGGLKLTWFDDDTVSFEKDLYGPKLLERVAEHGKVLWTGEADLVVGKTNKAEMVYVGEIKTANSRKYAGLPKQDPDKARMSRLMWRADKKYTRQLCQYIVLLKRFIHLWRPGTVVSDEAFFVFENTDTQDYRIIWFEADQELLEDAFKNSELSLRASAEGVLIERPYERTSRTCISCYSKRVCDALEDGDEKEWMSANKALEKLKTSDGQSSKLLTE